MFIRNLETDQITHFIRTYEEGQEIINGLKEYGDFSLYAIEGEEFPTKLKSARVAAGMSQADLAELAGVSIRTLQNYERGAREIERAEALLVLKLARALDIDPWLLMESE